MSQSGLKLQESRKSAVNLHPRVVGGIHAAEVVGVASELHELRHRLGAVVLVEVRQQRQPLDDLVRAFVDDLDDVLDVDLAEALVLRQVLVGVDRLGVHDLLPVDRDDLVAENRPQDRRELEKGISTFFLAFSSTTEAYLEVWLQEAPGGGDHRSLERTGNADVRQKLDDVRREAEGNWPR